jgi:hypothetical protein
LFFLAFFIIDILASLQKYYSTERSNKFLQAEQYIVLSTYCISNLLSGVLVLITKKLTKSTDETEIIDRRQDSLKHRKSDRNVINNKTKTILLIIAICLIFFVGRSASLIYYVISDDYTLCKESKNTWLIPIDIIGRLIFSKVILNQKIHRHHYLSLIIILLGFLSMFYIGIKTLDNSYYIIFFILKRLAFGIGDILAKKLFIKEFILPQNLMFYQGSFDLIIHCLIFLPIIIFSKQIIPFSDDKNSFFLDETSLEKGMKILFIIFIFIRNIIIYQIIYTFSPIHIGFLDIIIKYLDFIIPVFFYGLNGSGFPEPKMIIFIFYLISFMFVIFGTLLFSEIIIINICGLSDHTKPGIFKRIRLETVSFDSEIVYDTPDEENEALQ